MKNFFLILKITFYLTCTVVGSGVVTARETVGFFKGESLFLTVLLSAVLIIVFYVFSAIKYSSKGAENLMQKDKRNFFSKTLIFSNLLCFSGYLSQVNSFFSISPLRPFLMLIIIAVVTLVACGKVASVSKVISILSCLTFILVFTVVFTGKEEVQMSVRPLGASGCLIAVLFSAFNVFNAQPVLEDLTVKYGKKPVVISSVLCGALFFLFTFFLSSELSCFGAEELNADLPILLIANGNKPLVYSAILISVFCSLVSSSYPLFRKAKPYGSVGIVGVITAGFVFSTIGVKNITDFFYPVIGVIGAWYFISWIRRYLIFGIKTRRKVDTTLKDKEKKPWQRKRKIKLKN